MPDFRTLPDDLAAEITELQGHGARLIGLDRTASPDEIVGAIKEKMGALRDEGVVPEEDDIVGLGVLLGEQYVRRFDWHWAHVNFDDDFDDDNYFVCVLPVNNFLSINPIAWVNWILSGEKSNNVLLNFNMVAAGRVPQAGVNEAMGFY